MEGVIDDTNTQVPLVAKEVSMQIIGGQIYANTIQVSDGTSSFHITLDPNQHDYTTNGSGQLQILERPGQEEVVVDEGTEVELDQDEADQVQEAMQHQDISHLVKQEEDIASYLVSDPLSHSISHHDYTGTIPQILKPETSDISGIEDGLQETESGLVIEEAVEQEISTSQSLEDEEIIRSKPLTAMYLQRKEVTSTDSIYHPQELRLMSPSKSPGSSRFTLKPSARDFSYTDIDDISRMRLSYNDPISVYHPNTGEIQFTMDTDSESDKQRSVQAILAASEAIKHQDVASEVEIGCEVEVSPPKKGRKRKEKVKQGIDDDIEQIRKAAKNVAYTLKGMKDDKEGRKKRRPRIRLTLTKAKSRKSTTTISDDELDYDNSRYEKIGSSSGRSGKNEKYPDVIYQCEYCDKQFKTRAKVQSHHKIHTEDRAFRCDICGSEYRRREHLVRHYRRHTNERPYQCLECGKAYMRAEHLKRHSYDHTGEKPFECPVCPKAFTRHDRLIKHSLVHDK